LSACKAAACYLSAKRHGAGIRAEADTGVGRHARREGAGGPCPPRKKLSCRAGDQLALLCPPPRHAEASNITRGGQPAVWVEDGDRERDDTPVPSDQQPHILREHMAVLEPHVTLAVFAVHGAASLESASGTRRERPGRPKPHNSHAALAGLKRLPSTP